MNAKAGFALMIAQVFLTASCSVLQVRSQTPATSELKATISARQHIVGPGELLAVRIEVFNQSQETLYVGKELEGPNNALSFVRLEVRHADGKPLEGPGMSSAGDYFADFFGNRTDDPSALAGEFSKYWIALPPQHFYGGEIAIRPDPFGSTLAAGKYMIRGKYTAAGFLSSSINNPLANWVSEMRNLPYRAWVGSIDTNPIFIEVVKWSNR